jgi:CHC2 zinc finger
MTVDTQAVADRIAGDWYAGQAWLAEHPARVPQRRVLAPSSFRTDDVLLSIEPGQYVEALTGHEAPGHRMICCPLPDHEDGTPSFRAYPDPEEGWFCFGCARGGTIYDFAAALWGLQTRGSGFVELRQRLARALLGREAA